MTFCRLGLFCLDSVSSSRDIKSFENSWASWKRHFRLQWTVMNKHTPKLMLTRHLCEDQQSDHIYNKRHFKTITCMKFGEEQWGTLSIILVVRENHKTWPWAEKCCYRFSTLAVKTAWYFWGNVVILDRLSCYDLPAAVLCPDRVLWPALKGQCTFCCCSAGVQTDTEDAHRWTEAHNLKDTQASFEKNKTKTKRKYFQYLERQEPVKQSN